MSNSLLSDIAWHLRNRTSASRSFLAMVAWHFGYRLAEKHITRLSHYSEVEAKECELDISLSFWRRRSERAFDNGYHDPWAALGTNDAAECRCNRNFFANRSYLSGWLGEVQKRNSRGWDNPQLTKYAQLVSLLYQKPSLSVDAAEAQIESRKAV